MRRYLFAAVVVALAAVPAPALMIAFKPATQRAITADIVCIGKVTAIEKDTVDWAGTSLADFYKAVFQLKHTQAALWNGDWGGDQSTLRTDGGNRVYAFTRVRGASEVLVAVNFGDAAASVAYQGLDHPATYSDWFSKTPVSLAASGKLEIPAHGYRVLVRGRAAP